MPTRFLKLPFTLNPVQLRADLVRCQQEVWTDHFNTKDYTGDWRSLSLRSISGAATDIRAHDSPEEYQNTPLFDHCPYFGEIMALFRVRLQAVRLLALGPGSLIREHTDPQMGYEYGCFRLHIPLLTGSEVHFRVAGVDLPMQVGECWYADFHLPHSVANNGPTDRIHLVIDGLRNKWSDELFGRAGYDFEHEARMRDYSVDTKQRMIAELDRLDTDTARQLVAQLRQEMGQTSSAQS